jgi:hypothetical protein
MEKQKNLIIAILLIIIALLIIALVSFWVSENGMKYNNANIDDQNLNDDLLDLDLVDEELDGVVCAMDALECPDGTFVSRIPPTCDFAPCPDESVVEGDGIDDEILDPLEAIDSFDSCVGAGFPIMESMPEQCMTPDGRIFVNE